MKIVICIVIIFILILLGLFLYKKYIKDNILDKGNTTKYSNDLLRLINEKKTYDKLLEITYSCSGNSNGNIYRITLDIVNNKVIKEEKEYYSDPLKITEYSILEEDIKMIEKEIEEYNFPEWKDEQRDFEMIALDAATAHLTFQYDNSNIGGHQKEFYGIDFDLKLAKDCNEVLNDFAVKIQNLVKEENKIKEYMKEENE